MGESLDVNLNVLNKQVHQTNDSLKLVGGKRKQNVDKKLGIQWNPFVSLERISIESYFATGLSYESLSTSERDPELDGSSTSSIEAARDTSSLYLDRRTLWNGCFIVNGDFPPYNSTFTESARVGLTKKCDEPLLSPITVLAPQVKIADSPVDKEASISVGNEPDAGCIYLIPELKFVKCHLTILVKTSIDLGEIICARNKDDMVFSGGFSSKQWCHGVKHTREECPEKLKVPSDSDVGWLSDAGGDPAWLTSTPSLSAVPPKTYTPLSKRNVALSVLKRPCKQPFRTSSPTTPNQSSKAKRSMMEKFDLSSISDEEFIDDSLELVPRPRTPGTVNSDEIVPCCSSSLSDVKPWNHEPAAMEVEGRVNISCTSSSGRVISPARDVEDKSVIIADVIGDLQFNTPDRSVHVRRVKTWRRLCGVQDILEDV